MWGDFGPRPRRADLPRCSPVGGVYQAAGSPLLIVVTVLDHPEISEACVTIDGAATERPGDVWGEAASAFERWTAGDAVALDELVRVMTPVLWHVVRAYRLSTEVAEDVVQTTWLSLVRSRASIQEPAAVGGWLTTTARREAWKVAKATGRALPVEDDELARRLPDEGSAEAEVVRRDGDDRLWDAVERLSERCQAAAADRGLRAPARLHEDRRRPRHAGRQHRPDPRPLPAEAARPCRENGDDPMSRAHRRRPAGRRPHATGSPATRCPTGMVARLQTAAALAASDTDLDMELMLLVERTEELAGARGASTTAYTLRFAHDGVDLLLRISTDGAVPAHRRLGGPARADHGHRAPRRGHRLATLEVGDTGRFELPDLTPGMLRLRLEPADGSTPFVTPAFEI